MKCPKCKGKGEVPDPATVREKREHAGISLRKMADKMGICPTYLSDLERGKREWNPELTEVFNQTLSTCEKQ